METFEDVVAFEVSDGTLVDSMIDKRRQILLELMSSDNASSRAEVGETLNIIGLSYLSETDALSQLLSMISGVEYSPKFRAVFTDADKTYGGLDFAFEWGGLYHPNIALTTAFASARTVLFSSAENAVFEQLEGVDSVSTSRVLVQANATGLPILVANAANWEQQAKRLEAEYGRSQLATIRSYLDQAGYTSLILPVQDIQRGAWRGSGLFGLYSGEDGLALLSGRRNGDGSSALSGSQGGTFTEKYGFDPLALDYVGQDNSALLEDQAPNQADPLNPVSGGFIHPEIDSVISGAGGVHLGSFVRYYRDSTGTRSGRFGRGWSDSFSWTLSPASDYLAGIVGPRAVEATSMTAAIYVLLDVAQDRTTAVQARTVARAIIADWALGQVTDNALRLSTPSVRRFLHSFTGWHVQSISSAAVGCDIF